MINFKKYFTTKKGFIPFITAGDPSIDASLKYLNTLVEAGATLIEIGIPFSDPIAEGATIMEASARALSNGATLKRVFELVSMFRENNKDFPLVFMTYLNPVYAYGYDKFFKNMKDLNMQGIIIPDLPYEEKHEVSDVASKYDVAVISLIAPTSKDRIKMLASEAEGFVYLVSSLGVTGVRDVITTDIDGMAKEIKKYTDIPVCVGFGIKSPETAKKMCNVADGAIVGSAIVNIIAKYGDKAEGFVYDFAKSIVDEINK
ncbi:MAG: tryptophan synthase subunit alpha [Acholeplasmatales bacterium]|nr:tryptophan synthase subunit alpha [Acholeplasmatales bacterium]